MRDANNHGDSSFYGVQLARRPDLFIPLLTLSVAGLG
jgi:hypothetical protein